MARISLLKCKRSRDSVSLMPKTFRLHPTIAKGLDDQVQDEGCTQIHMIEKMIVFYINNGGPDAKIG